MNHTRILLSLTSGWMLLGLLVCSTVSLWGDNKPAGSCKAYCGTVGYQMRATVRLVTTPGQKPHAVPPCACVKPGGTVIWHHNDPDVPWTVDFDSDNPIDNPGKISDYDDEWFILSNAKEQEYHYAGKVGGQDLDPHIVVGQHPPTSDRNKQKKTKKHLE